MLPKAVADKIPSFLTGFGIPAPRRALGTQTWAGVPGAVGGAIELLINRTSLRAALGTIIIFSDHSGDW